MSAPEADRLPSDDIIEQQLQAGDWPAAGRMVTTRLQHNSDDAEALSYQGILYLIDKDYEAAAESFDKARRLLPEEARFHLNAGVARLSADKPKEAREPLEAAAAISPEDFAVNAQLGRLNIMDSRYPEALGHLLRATEKEPEQVEVLRLLAVCQRELGQLPLAIQTCEKALAYAPGDPWLRNCIAICMVRMGHFAEATRRVSQIIEGLPPEKDILFSLGLECQEQGSPHLGIEYLRKLYALFPNDVDACVNLGITLQTFGQAGEALFYFNKATQIADDCAEAYCRCGMVYESVRDYPRAMEAYEKALKADPKHVDTLARLASRRKEAGKVAEAKEMLREAIALNPDWEQLYLNLIAFCKETEDYEEAETLQQEAEKRWPSAQEVRHSRADLYLKRADIAGAMAEFRAILAEQPRNPDAMSGMLFCMNYDPDMSPEALADAYKDWDTRFNAHYRDRVVDFANDPDPDRKLRIGYVSGDFRGHSVGFFAEPILEHHDHQHFEIYCYANHNYIDNMTRKFIRFADNWRWIHDLTDEAVLEMIRLDQIDILIDLSNHTAFHRLYMFARRAAPIQMTWIGMPTTTGLSAIDYRITDARMDPPGMTEALHSEKLLRLVSGWCYRPNDEGRATEVGELPALRNGHLTFASFNAFGKINTRVITLWGRMLQAIPGAVLYMATGGKDDDEVLNEKVRSVFADCGFPVERLRLFGKKPMAEYLAFHNEIDIALDPFPYNGGTVTAHALWMAVPVLSLAGRKPIQRMGATMMGAVDLAAEFVANDEGGYVALAERWASDLPGLARIRAELRGHLQASPLMDAELVTRDLERQLRRVWQEWCQKQEQPEVTGTDPVEAD
ncbi:tetratricopeptide repeat protein [Parachitinimonas caeni]|uniref:protein O-GlcNAc transferase n=1 Tax=Parachitinimonas caeni TaxID=3031301 RepID=A0ABT7DWD2_9NEIS|nr:tetratricopeptide repeat protein [Parachitinimonas caeni]MDK2124346.1 tetratricopeptide repeat protein [Parachitinimonas caeni]